MKRRARIKLYKPRKIYENWWIRRGRRKPYINIYIYIYIYFRRDKKQKGTGVFGKLLKTFAEKITMSWENLRLPKE